MKAPTRFNVRAYGILIKDGSVLALVENIRGKKYRKFPGGGLELGEGLHDCLLREWKEELGMDVTVSKHFYTTDFFQPSAFDDSQVISIYYIVESLGKFENITPLEDLSVEWISCGEISEDTFPLPIDRIVALKLKEQSLNGYPLH